MASIEIVALVGLLLAWIGFLWLPLMVARVVRNRGAARLWAGAALLSYVAVFLGYTATIATDAPEPREIVWSLAWAVPLVLSILARTDATAVWRRADPWIGLLAAVTFVAVFPFLPIVFLGAAVGIWG